MFEYINEVSVLVAALLSVAVGSIWYSPLVCGNAWLRASGKTDLDVEYSSRELAWVTARAVMVNMVLFTGVAWLSTHLVVAHPLLISVGIATGSIIAHLSIISLWEKRPFTYVLVHGGYALIALLGGLSIILYWPW